jgi:hypothetical protein
MKPAIVVFSLLLSAACVETVSDMKGTITIRGRTYPTLTREFKRPDGSTYERMTIIVGAERVSCIPADIRDCELALTDIFVRDR